MEFVPYEKFVNVEFITEGGFSRIYKATWSDGPNNLNVPIYYRGGEKIVALKELNNSKNITSAEELNELKVFNNFANDTNDYVNVDNDHYRFISKYYGITREPITQNFMIIMKYYKSGDLTCYITKDFFNICWLNKLIKLYSIMWGLYNIHNANIIHKDFHGGNILINTDNPVSSASAIIGDLGISKHESIDDKHESIDDSDNEIYGIIPYVAPEIFQGQKYTKASDIYSFGMIMWELMTGRRPFWDRIHDTELIIKICDGLHPPIVTNAPEGYIELMKECWHPDPKKRPTIVDINNKIRTIWINEYKNKYKNNNPTKIIMSQGIGPITANSGAIYKSRPLSEMIKSAASTRSLKSLIINKSVEFTNAELGKRINDNLIEDNNDKIIKKVKNENNDYQTKEIRFDIDINLNSNKSSSNDYVTKEIKFDI